MRQVNPEGGTGRCGVASARQRGITALLGTLVMAGAWLAAQAPPTPRVPTFRKVILDGAFRSEGVALADVDRDGRMDVMAGNAWYAAPVPEATTTGTA